MTKEEILAEIRKTAKENDNKPLGVARFKNVTGIGPYEIGKYWSKYGDALKEAGFSPNSPWTRVPDETLVGQMILLIRELDKYPTTGEMRLYNSRNPNFPYTIIKKRKKPYIVAKIIEYCDNKPEYVDIIKICEPFSQSFSLEQVSEERQYGYVYLAKGHPGEYKIGRTNLVERRLSELGARASIEQSLVHEIKTDDPAGIEAYWHKRFQGKRMRGEWFKLNAVDVKAFKRWRRVY